MKFVYLTFISIILLSTFVLADWQNNEFVRGDVDQNLWINRVDAYFILNYLFNGGQAPLCLDSADWNDDGRIDISDAIGILNWLNSGEGGGSYESIIDLTSDNLDCQSYR